MKFVVIFAQNFVLRTDIFLSTLFLNLAYIYPKDLRPHTTSTQMNRKIVVLFILMLNALVHEVSTIFD